MPLSAQITLPNPGKIPTSDVGMTAAHILRYKGGAPSDAHPSGHFYTCTKELTNGEPRCDGLISPTIDLHIDPIKISL
jgi:hypothetical protein